MGGAVSVEELVVRNDPPGLESLLERPDGIGLVLGHVARALLLLLQLLCGVAGLAAVVRVRVRTVASSAAALVPRVLASSLLTRVVVGLDQHVGAGTLFGTKIYRLYFWAFPQKLDLVKMQETRFFSETRFKKCKTSIFGFNLLREHIVPK